MPALFGVGCIAGARTRSRADAPQARPARAAGTWVVAKIVVAVAFGVLAYLPILVCGVLSGKLRWTRATGRHERAS